MNKVDKNTMLKKYEIKNLRIVCKNSISKLQALTYLEIFKKRIDTSIYTEIKDNIDKTFFYESTRID